MPQANPALLAFNHGKVSEDALGRIDLDKLRLAGQVQTNYLSTVLGPAYMRAGFEYLNDVGGEVRQIPFNRSADDTARLIFGDMVFRVETSGALITSADHTATLNATEEASAIHHDASDPWVDASETASSASVSSDALLLEGGDFATAEIGKAFTFTAGQNTVRVVVEENGVQFSIGTASGLDDIFERTILGVGVHYLRFDAIAGDVHFTFRSDNPLLRTKVSGFVFQGAGVMQIATPYVSEDLHKLRYFQSADVVYLTTGEHAIYQVERRDNNSWSFVEYRQEKGPWSQAQDTRVRVKPSVYRGRGTLTATGDVFQPGHVGSLVRITHGGQRYTTTLTGEDQNTPAVRVRGTYGSERIVVVTITGLTGTTGTSVTLESSPSEDLGFVPSPLTPWTSDVTNINTGIATQDAISFQRLSIRTGEYGDGSPVATIFYEGGEQTGTARITSYNSPTSVDIEVIEPFSSLGNSRSWQFSEWSDADQWPTAVTITDGRLAFGGFDRVWLSASDDFLNFDAGEEGDGAPIARNIATGPLEGVEWLSNAYRLLIGTPSEEISVRSSTFDSPITPSDFALRVVGTQGSDGAQAVKIAGSVFFPQRNGYRLFELIYDGRANDYIPLDRSRLLPNAMFPGVKAMAVQMQPDSRIWYVTTDGKLHAYTHEYSDEVFCFNDIETDGEVLDVCVTKGDGGDDVYIIVKRTVDGADQYYQEVMRGSADYRGGVFNAIADSHVLIDQASSTTIAGLDHLEGREVIVWGNSKALGSYTVTGGSITVSEAIEKAVVGLTYKAQFKSMKLAYAAPSGNPLNRKAVLEQVGIVMNNAVPRGTKYGDDFARLSEFASTYEGIPGALDAFFPHYETIMTAIKPQAKEDTRLCIETQAPYPCTLVAASLILARH